jgi:glutamyl-tRNA reductase
VSELLAIGVSHKTAPVEVRERVALTNARVAEFVRDLRGTGEVHEAVTISTCNRTELYVVVGNPVEAESRALGMPASAPPSSLPRSTRCATATPRAICTASPRVSIR